jgi:ribonuclease Z
MMAARPGRQLLKSTFLAPQESPLTPSMVVTLLGTGSPTPLPDRFGPSALVQAGGLILLFDAGRGVPIRMHQLGVPLAKIDVLFLTHFHSDHTSGIPDVWLTRWVRTSGAMESTTPFNVIGPTGSKALMSNLEKAYATDIKSRLMSEPPPSPDGIATRAIEFDKDGVVYEKNGVKVIAFEVDHGPAIKPAYGYRIEFAGRSIVMSGDTAYNENVIKYGAGADLLIHEVAHARPELTTDVHFQRIMSHHTVPRLAGCVFSQAKPKLAVYTHFILRSSVKVPPPSLDDVIAQTRQTYGGPLELGEDLMSFEVGEVVTVRRYNGSNS